jgi:hypothetical protein
VGESLLCSFNHTYQIDNQSAGVQMAHLPLGFSTAGTVNVVVEVEGTAPNSGIAPGAWGKESSDR